LFPLFQRGKLKSENLQDSFSLCKRETGEGFNHEGVR
jgi:hypothetical protein